MAERPSARRRGYTWRWEKVRAGFLRQHPLCRMCEDEGRVEPARVVDHIVPHKGNQTLFWNTDNWQALCKPHHDSHKQSFERLGYIKGCGVDGWPLEKA